jgi:hypothetical protein
MSNIFLQNNQNSNNAPTKTFYPTPGELIYKDPLSGRLDSIPSPFIQQPQTISSIDVGQDTNLQNNVTLFFHKKILKWIKNYKDFSHLKKHYHYLQSNEGIVYINNMLKLFVKKSNANWYDLRDPHNYPIVKDFLKHKTGNI